MRPLITFTILMTTACWLNSIGASPLPQGVEKPKVQANIDPVLDQLKPILKASGKAARIYYLGSCKKEDDFYEVSFPHINVKPPLRADIGLAAIRDVFRNEENIRVSEEINGIIRIVVGQLPSTILDTKISTITLSQNQQYTENLALWRIEDSKEVDRATQKMRIHPDGIPLRTTLVRQPIQGAPHLPPTMNNLTLDEALDSVVKIFGGIVVYGTCATPRLYTIHYVSLKS